MDKNLIIKKIQALLHDPPEKPIILGRIGHEGRAKEIMGQVIDEANIPDDVRTADHIASAADRINLPKDERFTSDFCKSPIIIHPLSGKQFDLKSLAQLDSENITFDVNEAIIRLNEKYKDDHNKLYLALWRELSDELVKRDGKSKVGQLWELLPADTRIPDHSIWEHKRITSAIAGALPKPAFLLFAIGPVQDFIATARKTQDLWAGSYLLSYLSWRAMKVVAEEFGPDSLIFPDLCRQPFADLWLINNGKGLNIEKPKPEELSSPTLPNRFLAIVPAGSVEDIADQSKKAVKGAFKEVCNTVKTKMAEILDIVSSEWDEIWNRQIEDFIETYWAAVLVNNYTDFLTTYKQLMGITSVTDFDKLLSEYQRKGFAPNVGTVYGQIYRFVEKTLGSRKTVRDFQQIGEPNHKCTLCGVREPVHPGTYNERSCSENFGALRGFWQEKVLPTFPQIRKSERLCGVCITKRLSSRYYFKEKLQFDIEDNFPSVSMVATASFKLRVIENINNPKLSVLVKNYVNIVRSLVGDRWSGVPIPMVIRACRDEISRDFAKLDGDWLFKEAFDDERTLLEENEGRLSDNDLKLLLKSAKERQKELFDGIRELDKNKEPYQKIGSPSKYYAILLMDGDNMGKWLSGEFAPAIGDVLHPFVKNTLATNPDWEELLKQRRPLNPVLHLATSKALRDFSLRVVREIVEKDHLGKLVYAGGDDVLAFVNLRDLLDVMRKLRAYFSGSLTKVGDDAVKIDFKDGSGFIPVDSDGEPINVDSRKSVKGFMLSMGTSATASMGVVIAHHNSNLSQVLDEVRKSEKEEAKKIEGKNAFCIALEKRAGEMEHISAKWYYDDNFESILLLRQWADAFFKDWISPKLVYTFRTETKGLEGLPHEAIRYELIRIADRHRNTKAQDFTKEQMTDLVDGLMNLHKNGISLYNIVNFLSVAKFLGEGENR